MMVDISFFQEEYIRKKGDRKENSTFDKCTTLGIMVLR